MIGIQYLVTTFAFFLIGGLCAEAFRTELAKPGLQFMTADQYNGLMSVHAALMIFLFVIPAFAGLANFVIPLMLGADDMAFPRLNALSFWMLPTAGVMMVASLFWQGFGAGWTAYAPLASDYQTVSQLFFNIGVQFAGHLVDPDGGQLHRHDPDDARSGHDAAGGCRSWSGPT